MTGMSGESPGIVHLAGFIRPFAACGSFDAAERHSKDPGEVTCPDCALRVSKEAYDSPHDP
jgi:hypothetical protein